MIYLSMIMIVLLRLRCADSTIWEEIISFYPSLDLSKISKH